MMPKCSQGCVILKCSTVQNCVRKVRLTLIGKASKFVQKQLNLTEVDAKLTKIQHEISVIKRMTKNEINLTKANQIHWQFTERGVISPKDWLRLFSGSLEVLRPSQTCSRFRKTIQNLKIYRTFPLITYF